MILKWLRAYYLVMKLMLIKIGGGSKLNMVNVYLQEGKKEDSFIILVMKKKKN